MKVSMKIKQFKSTAPKFKKLKELNIAIKSGDQQVISKTLYLLQIDDDFQGIAWQKSFAKLANLFATGNPEFTIFMKGNSKLPFYAFSSLPGVTCPGAGDCIDFCYSYRAWRYPSAFARQCQNAWLMIFNRPVIAIALAKIKGNFDLRLYVDGDFANIVDLDFWMTQCKLNPNIQAYGYSKSFALFLAYELTNTWPINYMLNISSGHNSSPQMVNYVKQLYITRGEFIAVNIGFKPEHGSIKTNAAIRAQFDEKIFPCPGKCGSCTGLGHACGLPQMKFKTIAIAIH